jgi:hypothetical protein
MTVQVVALRLVMYLSLMADGSVMSNTCISSVLGVGQMSSGTRARSAEAMACTCHAEDSGEMCLTSMLPESKWLLTKMPDVDLAESQLPVVPVTAPSAHLQCHRRADVTQVSLCMTAGCAGCLRCSRAHLRTGASQRCGKGGSAIA